MSKDNEPANSPVRKLYQEVKIIELQLETIKTLYAELIAAISLDQNKDESVGRLREVIQYHIRFAIEHGGMPKLSEYLMDRPNPNDQQPEKVKKVLLIDRNGYLRYFMPTETGAYRPL